MGARKRYFFTAGGLILLLIFLVMVARYAHRANSSSSFENTKVKGPKGAPIQMVIYSDFQCPACRFAREPVEELVGQFPGKIQVHFRHFPIDKIHQYAFVAAKFAECAGEQGKFWAFHDQLYKKQETWAHAPETIVFFARYAQESGLDPLTLERCLEDPKTLGQIRLERSIGAKQGVQSTPTIFLNGRPLVGPLQLKAQGKNIVLEELKKLASKLRQ